MEDRKCIKINPYSEVPKNLKFLRTPEGKLSDMAKLEGDLEPIRCGYTSEEEFFILPKGGPRLIEGHPVPGHSELTIIKIHYIEDKMFYVLNVI